MKISSLLKLGAWRDTYQRPGPHWNPLPKDQPTLKNDLKEFVSQMNHPTIRDVFGLTKKHLQALSALFKLMQSASYIEDWEKAKPVWKRAFGLWAKFEEIEPHSNFMLHFEALRRYMQAAR